MKEGFLPKSLALLQKQRWRRGAQFSQSSMVWYPFCSHRWPIRDEVNSWTNWQWRPLRTLVSYPHPSVSNDPFDPYNPNFWKCQTVYRRLFIFEGVDFSAVPFLSHKKCLTLISAKPVKPPVRPKDSRTTRAKLPQSISKGLCLKLSAWQKWLQMACRACNAFCISQDYRASLSACLLTNRLSRVEVRQTSRLVRSGLSSEVCWVRVSLKVLICICQIHYIRGYV